MDKKETSNLLEQAQAWTPPQKNKPGRKSKLTPYGEAITYLKEKRNLSYKDIHTFLAEKGVQVSYPTLTRFAKPTTS